MRERERVSGIGIKRDERETHAEKRRSDKPDQIFFLYLSSSLFVFSLLLFFLSLPAKLKESDSGGKRIGSLLACHLQTFIQFSIQKGFIIQILFKTLSFYSLTFLSLPFLSLPFLSLTPLSLSPLCFLVSKILQQLNLFPTFNFLSKLTPFSFSHPHPFCLLLTLL